MISIKLKVLTSLRASIAVVHIAILFALGIFISGCEKFLEVPTPRSLVERSEVFKDNITADAAMAAVYAQMRNFLNFASGSRQSLPVLAGLSSDELIFYPSTEPDISQFEDNVLQANNIYVESIWSTAYGILYQSNAVIEGLSNTSGVSAAYTKQLIGEALFARAFTHFYLVNIFGEVPIVTSTDYRLNSTLSRSPIDSVYNQILEDLLEAKSRLSDEYFTPGRVRPNKGACSAFLSRVYLFMGQWQNAVDESTEVIDNPLYELAELSDVFLSTSSEAIWQYYHAPNSSITTMEAYTFIIEQDYQIQFLLSESLLAAFEPGDLRKSNWVKNYTNAAGTFPFPYKYKYYAGGGNESSTVLRLAEQFLIRAEANAMLGNTSASISDVDELRSRAALPLVADTDPGISIEELLTLIAHERRIELFSEWGDRWLDLKRRNEATEVLGQIKDNWDASDLFYPIPQSELNKNPNL